MNQITSDRSFAAEHFAGTVRAIAVVTFILLLCWVLGDLLPMLFMAVLLAVMLRGASEWAAERTGASPIAMVATISVLVLLLTLGFLYYLGPQLAQQLSALWDRLQQILTTLRESYGQTALGHRAFESLSNAGGGVSSHIAGYVGQIANYMVSGAAWVLIVIATTLYLAISPDLYINGAVSLFPLRYRDRARNVLRDIGRTLQWWSLGQLIDMTVVGLLSCLGLELLGVPLPLALGALAGILTFVPYFGAIAAAVPAMLVALTVSWQDALWTLGIFLICHGIEGYIVSPIVQRRMIHLPPALSIVSMVIWSALVGPLGVVIGTPLAGVALIATREIYVAEVLGDPKVEGPGGVGV